MDNGAVIQTRGLTKRYGSQTAVDGLDLEIKSGEIFGFLGPNGAGKTTTLLMLLGLCEPTSGSLKVLGINPTKNPIEVKRHVGYLQENMGFYPDLNARQMLEYIAELNNIDKKDAEERIHQAITTVGLGSEAEKRIGAYSRGMRQRLGIAEIILKKPDVVFLDEPTLGLDPDATNRIIKLIKGLCEEDGITVLLSSHQLQQVQKICHRIGIMIKGKMVAIGTMDNLAREKLGIDGGEYTLEEIYMKYFMEA